MNQHSQNTDAQLSVSTSWTAMATRPVQHPGRGSLRPLVRYLQGGNMVLCEMTVTQILCSSAPRTIYGRYSHGPLMSLPGVPSALPDSTRDGGHTTLPSFAAASGSPLFPLSPYLTFSLSRRVDILFLHAVSPPLQLPPPAGALLDGSPQKAGFSQCIFLSTPLKSTRLSSPRVVPPPFSIMRVRARANVAPLPVQRHIASALVPFLSAPLAPLLLTTAKRPLPPD